MKNKIYYILLGIIVSFSFINSVFAEGELDFSVKANVLGDGTTYAAGSEVVIDVGLVSDTDIDRCIFNVVADSGLELISESGMNNYVIGEDENGVLVYRANTEVGFTSGTNILELKYKINADSKVVIKTVECSSSVDTKGSYEDISFDFKVSAATEDTSLKSLIVKGGILSPAFTSTQTQYIVDLELPEFTLEMVANNEDYQDKIVVTDASGVKLDPSKITFKDLSSQGMMELIITVNKKTEYVLLVKYEQEGVDNSLKTLKVYGKEIKLQEGKYDYKITVSKDAKSVRIDAVLADSENFKFADNNGPTTFQVPNATNVYPLIIEPKNASIGASGVTYTITVLKEGMVDTDSSNGSSGGNNSNNNQGNVTNNPTTGVSMFIMAFILIVSLIGSIYLYYKNMEAYNNK